MKQEFIGHDRVRDMLTSFSTQQSIPHALLFVGPSSVGKRTIGQNFLQSLHCIDKASGACGECRSCRLLPEGKLPDAQIVSPEGNISIDLIRSLQERLTRSAIEGTWKTALLSNIERMRPEASNALLKTLEEPPANSLLLLTASSTKSLLPTIVSRCAVLPFRRVSDEAIRTALMQRPAKHMGSLTDLAVLLQMDVLGVQFDFLKMTRLLQTSSKRQKRLERLERSR